MIGEIHAMMKWYQLVSIVLLFHARSNPASAQVSSSGSATDAEAVAWMRAHAIPLRSVEAGTGTNDLRALETVLKDVRILGLGEAVHGSREFFQVKHRLLEFLVTRMGFNAFAMEAAYSDAQPANDYVLHGKGERDSVLTALGYVAWDTEEIGAMLDWMRAYNRTVPGKRKVRFYGVDIFRNATGRRKVLAFVQRFAPDLETGTDSLFRELAAQEGRWPRWDTTVMARARPRLAGLANELAARRSSLRSRVIHREYEEVVHLIEVMRQGALPQDRSRFLAENLMYLVDRAPPGAKFVFSAHDSHVAADQRRRGGYHLRKVYGDAYYATSLSFNHGTYLTRNFPPPGELTVAAASPAHPGSLPWFFSQVGIPRFFLDIRSASRSPSIDGWLRTPRESRTPGWAYADPTKTFFSMNARGRFDGILFVSELTPTRPTRNARDTVARGAGF